MNSLYMAIAAALLSLSAVAETGRFPLQVNDVSGLDAPWPLIGGLPFPQGELHDPAQLRIVDSQGVEVSAQIDVISRWRDGSIRWALAGLNASPQRQLRVAYGPAVRRSAPAQPLTMEQGDDGALTVDTGVAVYTLLPDRLLPESGRLGDTVFLANSGAGAYLIDNQGRLARVAGTGAEVETQILKQGPLRTVLRRSGWYVTGEGERVARAKAWFYFTAGSPYVRITHSLVLTEDTNELWVRDYGLDFRTPEPADEAVFALSEGTWADTYMGGRGPEEAEKLGELAEMFSSGLVQRQQTLFPVELDGGEVYMLQDEYPHVLEREFRAVVARAGAPLLTEEGDVHLGTFWVHPWLRRLEVVGDWAEARYGGHALGVVMPQLAQRFPKEIAVGPAGVRVAFWSGRSGRELDFRAVTLVNETWQQWADNANHPFGLKHTDRGPAIGTRIAHQPSNAQGAARTHDVWLLPRTSAVSDAELKAQALAAAHPPLLQADPAWLGNSTALGWPVQAKDSARFPEVEAALSDHWEEILGNRFGHAELRRSGFIMWGKNITLGTGPRWFRLSQGRGHYKLDVNAWQLYARSGERRYYDYGRHFTRFAGDLSLHHWTAGDRFRGGFTNAEVHLPFYWHGPSTFNGSFWTWGWLAEYTLTGDEYANELLQMVADAYIERADDRRTMTGYQHGHLYNLSVLYDHTGHETLRELARQAADNLIDLDNPVGLNDELRYGIYYKTSTEWLFPLYLYYNATGDATAREAILRALDDKFRFFYSSNQTFRLFMFSEGYRWTGNPAYLRLVKLMVEEPFFSLMGHNYLLGAPTALHAVANADQPIDAFPVLAVTNRDDGVPRSDFFGHLMPHTFIEGGALPPLLVGQAAGSPVTLSIFVRLADDFSEDTEPVVRLNRLSATGDARPVDEVQIAKTQRFETRRVGRNHLRRWHLKLTLPSAAEAGTYRLEIPQAATIVVLESEAESVTLATP